jgi:hypothetical protein
MVARMAYCGPLGIPLSVFLGWPEDDQDAALQWQAREHQKCSGCGTHPSEWNPSEGGSRQAYRAALEMCPGCATRDTVAQGEQAKQAGPGFRVSLYRNV